MKENGLENFVVTYQVILAIAFLNEYLDNVFCIYSNDF